MNMKRRALGRLKRCRYAIDPSQDSSCIRAIHSRRTKHFRQWKRADPSRASLGRGDDGTPGGYRAVGTSDGGIVDSYAQGTSSVPLLGETISQNLRRTVQAFGSRDALVVRHQGYQATYAEF